MEDELMIVDALDQPVPVDTTAELQIVDEMFEQSMKENDPLIMFGYMLNIQKQFQVQGMALTKSCYLMNKYWDAYEVGDNFLDTASEYLGIHRHTVERYIKIWEMITIAPKHIARDLQQKGLTTLVPVANALAQGYEIQDSVWERIVDAPDYATTQRIINEEVKETEGRSSRLNIMLDRNGSLWAITKDERFFIGSLEVDDDRDVVKKAIERLVKNAGVLKQ
jgi:hypothetical protein